MSEDSKSLLEMIICGIIGFCLCRIFGLIGGLLILAVVIILWFCLCWFIDVIFDLGSLVVDKLLELVDKIIDKFDDIDKK